MSKPIVRRLIVVLALSAFLGSPATSLAGSRSNSAPRHSRHQTAAQTPLSWLRSTMVRIWEKTGCKIDPYGQCLPATTQGNAGDGCSVGPDGQCVVSTGALTTTVK
jgi:hypothetical protein